MEPSGTESEACPQCHRVNCICPGPRDEQGKVPRQKPVHRAPYLPQVELIPGLGKKYDEAKPRWDLLPWGPIESVVQVLTFGANKYGPNNWKLVEGWRERYYAALMRHLVAYRSGEWLDTESGLPHLAHLGCCWLFIFWMELTERKVVKNGQDGGST